MYGKKGRGENGFEGGGKKGEGREGWKEGGAPPNKNCPLHH